MWEGRGEWRLCRMGLGVIEWTKCLGCVRVAFQDTELEFQLLTTGGFIGCDICVLAGE